MPAALHLLVVDADTQHALTLAQFALDRGHQAATCGSQSETLVAVHNQHQARMPYGLLLLRWKLPDGTALSVSEQLEAKRCLPPFAVILPPTGVSASDDARLRQLGCRKLFHHPVDLAELQSLLDLLGQDATPFFGTGSGHYTRTPSGPSLVGTAGYRRISSAIIGAEDPFSAADRVATSAISQPGSTRNYNRTRSEQFTTGFHKPPTVSVRRSITGRIEREVTSPGRDPETARLLREQLHVVCAYCGKEFGAPRKETGYNIPCLHCGELNHIQISDAT